LDYFENYGSLIICMHATTKNETLVKIGSVVVEIFGDIGQFRPSNSTIFIFYPTLTQKLLNQFSPFFTRCRAISVAINVRIHNERVLNEGHFANFTQNWLPWQRPLRYQKKRSRSIICIQKKLSFGAKIVKIGPADTECHWMLLCQMNEYCTISALFIFNPTLTQKLLNPFSSFFTRSRVINGAINACICKTILHFVSEHESKD